MRKGLALFNKKSTLVSELKEKAKSDCASTIIIIIIVLLLCFALSCTLLSGCSSVYSNIDDFMYKIIIGDTENHDIETYRHFDNSNLEKAVSKEIDSYFPEEIEPIFSNPYYAFHQNWNNFEMLLTFEIEDEAEYQAYLKKAVPTEELIASKDAPGYLEYVISDDFHMYGEEESLIHWAKIRKVLVQPEEQRFVFVAVVIHNETKTYIFTEFFSYFSLDPIAYAHSHNDS